MTIAKSTRRRLLNVLSAASLAACAAVCLLWARTPGRSDVVGWAGWRDESAGLWHGWGVASARGRLDVYYFTSASIRFDDPTSVGGNGQPDLRPHAFHHVHGNKPPAAPAFRFDHIAIPWIDAYLAGAPHGVLAALFGAVPAWVACRWLLNRRRTPGGPVFEVVIRPGGTGGATATPLGSARPA